MAHSTGPSCCWYHKGTIFQANHNMRASVKMVKLVVVDTTKVRFFKQITTETKIGSSCVGLLLIPQRYDFSSKSQQLVVILFRCCSCCWYHKGTIFQANHNWVLLPRLVLLLLLIPQRYDFSSKSQHSRIGKNGKTRCCWYHKGTIFQANHNEIPEATTEIHVVVDTTKVRFFKQITTLPPPTFKELWLLLIPQRYYFSSKSQLIGMSAIYANCCCWYHKGTIFQANHNAIHQKRLHDSVVVDTTKVRFFKQITTSW